MKKETLETVEEMEARVKRETFELPPLSKRQQQIIAVAKDRVCGLLDEEAVEMFADFKKCLQAADDPDKFKFPVSAKITLTPIRSVMVVKCELSWGIKKHFDCEVELSAQPEIPGIADPAK